MKVIDTHEVSIDIFGDGKDIWSARWAGGIEVDIYRGDAINNRMVAQHVLRLQFPGTDLKEFVYWAELTLNDCIKKAENPYGKEEVLS